MATTKLTLSADEKLIERAKKLAKQQGTSLSAMFVRYLEALLQQQKEEYKISPLVKQMTGLAKAPEGKTDRELIEEALAEKYDL